MARAAVLERLTASDWRVGTVVASRPLTPSIQSLELDVPGWAPHRAGQHIDVRLTAEDGYQAQRSYSIASAPETPTLTLAVQRLPGGELSPYLADDVVAGDLLELRGPVGGPFTWSVDDGGPLLLVGGGSGLAPLMAMVRHRAARRSDAEAYVLGSMRTPNEALFRPELDELAAGAGLTVRWTFTRTPQADVRPGDLTGRVSAGMLEALGPAPSARPLAFVCGSDGFVDHVATLLVALGHDPERIRTERFGPT